MTTNISQSFQQQQPSFPSPSQSPASSSRSSSSDFDMLPSSRAEYICNHPTTVIAKLHSDHNKIAPIWSKVSSTPYLSKALLCGGYGRRIGRTAISTDAPSEWLHAEKVKLSPNNPYNNTNNNTNNIAMYTSITKMIPTTSSDVLPGGQSMQIALTKKLPHSRFRTFGHGKQTYLDPLYTDRDGNSSSKIEWRDTPVSTARSSQHSEKIHRGNNYNSNNNSSSSGRMNDGNGYNSARNNSARSRNNGNGNGNSSGRGNVMIVLNDTIISSRR